MRGLGWLPDLEDLRDHAYRALLQTYPEAHSNAALVVSILDQGRIGSCVANAGFQAIRMSQVRQGFADSRLGARLFGYALARAYDGTPLDEDSGTHLRTFFYAVNKHGFLREADYAYHYDTALFSKPPHPRDYRKAYDQRYPTRYRRIDSTGDARIEDIKLAVAEGFAVTFGTSVSVEFASQGKNDTLWFPPTNESIAGGHAQVVISYDGEVFGVCNSWGENVGVQGIHRFHQSYFSWSGTRDLWVVEATSPFSE